MFTDADKSVSSNSGSDNNSNSFGQNSHRVDLARASVTASAIKQLLGGSKFSIKNWSDGLFIRS
jgi:hypothetical protein